MNSEEQKLMIALNEAFCLGYGMGHDVGQAQEMIRAALGHTLEEWMQDKAKENMDARVEEVKRERVEGLTNWWGLEFNFEYEEENNDG